MKNRIVLPADADWIIEDKLCAMSLPDEATISQLAEAGFSLVITVASERYADPVGKWCAIYGLRHLRYWVPDMAPPAPNEIRDFVAEVAYELRRGGRVAVHCLGGVGRTGTMIACYLVAEGVDPEAAIREVRRRRPGSVRTLSQEMCIIRYAAECRQLH
ncbi:MAG: phosphatase domain-containing protein [Candidatus Zipacnadales bacterium]